MCLVVPEELAAGGPGRVGAGGQGGGEAADEGEGGEHPGLSRSVVCPPAGSQAIYPLPGAPTFVQPY